ncbi:choice-of-anchor I family protein [Algiphilus sp.]|uniref:choice-of-anchor I family protein n=1 Tax=Algiphilus sp. TaxID=1872431 RepID=UPI0025BB42D6|nr:choice-of-anchor I family protein [Algiphilus sp.]MCK5769861.1 collagen-like protein [Algiphilus sp.]
MTIRLTIAAAAVAGAAALAGCEGDDGSRGPEGPAGQDGQDGAPGAPGDDASRSSISLSKIGSFRNPEAGFDEAAAEIVAFDAATAQLYIVNAQAETVDIVDLSSPSAPTLSATLDVAGDVATARSISADALGAANSVAISSGVVAVAIEADPKQDPGYVAFYQATDGTFLSAVQVGALPDMVTFSPDGAFAITANEGEPSGDYTNDPEGSVSIIAMSGGAGALTDASVTAVTFEAFNDGGDRAGELDARVRTPRPFGASVAQDLEPEYIAVSDDSATAWASLQENSGFVEIDLATATITAIWGTGTKDHAIPGNELDASDDDDAIRITNWPVRGLLMPDSMASYGVNGKTFLVTANEGDGREYIFDTDEAGCDAAMGLQDFDDGECLVYLDEIRAKDIVDPDEVGATIDSDLAALFPGAATDSDGDTIPDLFEDGALGRINIIATEGLADASCLNSGGQPTAACVYEDLITYGARSFSIFDTSTRSMVYDSGSDFEVITANRLGENGFNASNDENDVDSRSDAKGPEPEALALGRLEGRTYAFVGLERVGGIMVYDVSNPESPDFVQYINTRDFSEDPAVDDAYNPASGDLGPEGIVFVPAADSPSGNPLLLVGYEISGTTAIFDIDVIAP